MSLASQINSGAIQLHYISPRNGSGVGGDVVIRGNIFSKQFSYSLASGQSAPVAISAESHVTK